VRDTHHVKATGLQGDASPEIIEILDDDTDAFGDRAPSHTMHDSGGPRWIAPVAATALIGLIGWGVATSASGNEPRVTPVTSTTAVTTTTTRPPPTTIASPPVPYYAVDAPPDYAIAFAEMQTIGSGDISFGDYQLWAEPGASADTGKWFSIEPWFTGPGNTTLNAHRVDVDGIPITVSHIEALAIATVEHSDQTAVRITAAGWTDDQLIQFAATVKSRGFNIDPIDVSITAGYELVNSVPPWIALQGAAEEQIFYQSQDNAFGGGLNLTVSAQQPKDAAGTPVDRQLALRFLLGHRTPFEVNGHSAIAGQVIGDNTSAIATWTDNGNIVTLYVSGTVPEAIALARTVHQVSATEWADMQQQAREGDGGFDEPAYASSPEYPISFGTDIAANAWDVRVSMATFGETRQVRQRHQFGADRRGNDHHAGDRRPHLRPCRPATCGRCYGRVARVAPRPRSGGRPVQRS
jgi:hypothetical protein